MSDDTYNAGASSESRDDSYNGWTNRETWALNLWLSNDQGLYEATRERVAEAIDEAQDDDDDPKGWLEAHGARVAGVVVEAFWEELTDPDEGLLPVVNILEMVRDVGSEYRVNWDEIGAAWLSDLQAES